MFVSHFSTCFQCSEGAVDTRALEQTLFNMLSQQQGSAPGQPAGEGGEELSDHIRRNG